MDRTAAGCGPRQRLLDLVGTQLTLHRLYEGAPPRVGARWEVDAILGSGGFGVVLRCRDLQLQRIVALKLHALGDERARRAAVREGRSLALLDHPAIVVVHSVDEEDLVVGDTRVPCAVVEMQLVDGQTLVQWLQAAPRAMVEVLDVLVGAGRALAHAHAHGVIHRDFKPGNVMIDRAGHPKVIDFGLALVARGTPSAGGRPWSPQADAIGTRDTATGAMRGTPGYMAPELAMRQPSPASDQFAFAVVVAEVLYGNLPLAGGRSPATGLPRLGGQLASRLRPLLARAMDDAPAARFPNMQSLCDAIEAERRRPRSGVAAATRRVAGLLGLAGLGVALSVFALSRRSDDRGIATTPASPPTSEAPAGADTNARCPDQEPFLGAWNVGVEISWSESRLDIASRRYELRVTAGADCELMVEADRRIGAELTTMTTTVVPTIAAAPAALRLRLHHADDARRYGIAEHDELLLSFDDDPARLSGAYRRADDAGLVIHRGKALGLRAAAPSEDEVSRTRVPCPAACWLDCAGSDAEAACAARGCAPFERDSDDRCGPSDASFTPPVHATVVIDQLRNGRPPDGDGTTSTAACEEVAANLAGTWGVWHGSGRDARRFSLDIQAEGCRLRGHVIAPDGGSTISVTGQATAQGVWTIASADARFSRHWVLVGTGPAFGLDGASRAARIRAFRRSG